MVNKSKKTISFLIAALLIALLIPTAIAYYIVKDNVNNSFTVGENTSHIEEIYSPPVQLEAGESYEKTLTVKNDGSIPCYVRVFAEIEDPRIAEAITVDFNTNDWTSKQSDGYYYYKKILNVSESTSPLFTSLNVSKDVAEFQMICYSETVQAAGYSDPQEAFK